MATLSAGDQAPAFTSKNQEGKEISLDDFKGHRFALYFYPKDDTPGCTAEACSFRDNYEPLKTMGLGIVGVSGDDELSHQKFITKYELPFPLIADIDHRIAEAYGVWVEKNNYGKKYMGIARTTFIINGNQKIEHVIKKIDTKDAAGQLMEILKTV